MERGQKSEKLAYSGTSQLLNGSATRLETTFLYVLFRFRYKKDLKKSFEFALKAATAGNPRAMGLVGTKYRWGDGVEKNYVLAEEWFNAQSMLEMESPLLIWLPYSLI